MSDYQAAWGRYRFWRNLAILALVGFFPASFLARIVARYFSAPYLFSVIIIGWALFVISTGAEVAYWPCPRCGKRFSSKWGLHLGVLARHCLHCGLPKYSDG